MNDMQQQPAKGGSKLLWIILGCLGCAGLGVVGMFLLGGGLFLGIMKAAEPAKNDAKTFLKQAASGDIDGAYAHFADELKAIKSKEAFKAEVEGNKHLFDVKDTTFNNVNFNNNEWTLRGTVQGADVKTYGAKFRYIVRDGGLKMMGYGLRDAPYGENE